MKLSAAVLATLVCLLLLMQPMGTQALGESYYQTKLKTESAERQTWILAGGIAVAGIAVAIGIYLSRKPPRGN